MNKQDLIDCYKRISPYVHNTPVLTSHALNKISAAEIYFKCENFQKVGAFKIRGATNAVLSLPAEKKIKGVATHSSGNFAQALALAASTQNIKSYIIMPSNSPKVKKDAVNGYGGIIIECEPTLEAREKTAREVVNETGAEFIHPFNDTNVILGQGTACMELLEVYPDLRVIIAPVGGGGLISGTALSADYFGKNCKVIGGEPFEVDDAYRSLQSGRIEENKSTNTIADGLKTNLGDKTFAIIQKHVEKIIRVTEDEIISAMRLIWERMKIIVEPSAAVAFAAVLKERENYKNKKVGLILSGGNVDLDNLPF